MPEAEAASSTLQTCGYIQSVSEFVCFCVCVVLGVDRATEQTKKVEYCKGGESRKSRRT